MSDTEDEEFECPKCTSIYNTYGESEYKLCEICSRFSCINCRRFYICSNCKKNGCFRCLSDTKCCENICIECSSYCETCDQNICDKNECGNIYTCEDCKSIVCKDCISEKNKYCIDCYYNHCILCDEYITEDNNPCEDCVSEIKNIFEYNTNVPDLAIDNIINYLLF